MMDGWQSDDQPNGRYSDISLARITTSSMMYFSNLKMVCARLNDRLDVSAPKYNGPPVAQRRGGRMGRNRQSEQGRLEEVQSTRTKEEESVRWLYVAARRGAAGVWCQVT